jgi:hypothetical protein
MLAYRLSECLRVSGARGTVVEMRREGEKKRAPPPRRNSDGKHQRRGFRAGTAVAECADTSAGSSRQSSLRPPAPLPQLAPPTPNALDARDLVPRVRQQRRRRLLERRNLVCQPCHGCCGRVARGLHAANLVQQARLGTLQLLQLEAQLLDGHGGLGCSRLGGGNAGGDVCARGGGDREQEGGRRVPSSGSRGGVSPRTRALVGRWCAGAAAADARRPAAARGILRPRLSSNDGRMATSTINAHQR